MHYGYNLGFDALSSQVVSLALRHAILPKSYGSEYKLLCEWGSYGKPEHFYTDGGKDFSSNHLREIGAQLGFVCHLRHRPCQGGIVERPFKTLNWWCSSLAGIGGVVARWERFHFNPRPSQKELEAIDCILEVDTQILAKMLPHPGVSIQYEPILLCGACYAKIPCHLL